MQFFASVACYQSSSAAQRTFLSLSSVLRHLFRILLWFNTLQFSIHLDAIRVVLHAVPIVDTIDTYSKIDNFLGRQLMLPGSLTITVLRFVATTPILGYVPLQPALQVVRIATQVLPCRSIMRLLLHTSPLSGVLDQVGVHYGLLLLLIVSLRGVLARMALLLLVNQLLIAHVAGHILSL